jgi:hypothetical protein
MSFLGGLGRAVVGGITGLAQGGPLGAAVGVLGGAFGGGDKEKRQSSSTSSTSTSTTKLRPWEAGEQAMVNNAMGSIAANQPMTAADASAQRDRIYSSLFDPAAKALNESAATSQAQLYSSAARRGAADNTATRSEQLKIEARKGSALADVSSSASLKAEDVYLQEEQNRRNNILTSIQELGQAWNQRLQGSTIVQTGGQSGTATSTTPNNFFSSAAAGIGSAVTDKNSYFNKVGFLGMGGPKKV